MFFKRVKSYAHTCNENKLRDKERKSGRGSQDVLRNKKKNYEIGIKPIRFDSICHWTNTFSAQFKLYSCGIRFAAESTIQNILREKKLTLQQIMLINCWFPLSMLKRKKEKSERINDEWNARICFCPSHSSIPFPYMHTHTRAHAHAHTCYPVSLFSCLYLWNIRNFRALNGKSSASTSRSMIVMRARPSTSLINQAKVEILNRISVSRIFPISNKANQFKCIYHDCGVVKQSDCCFYLRIGICESPISLC